METLLIYYFLIALAAFGMWFIVFLNDSTTPLSDRKSWVILVLASFCWPITVPSSIAKLTTTTGNTTQSVSIKE
ncbi:putative membrane protein [Lyngbya aestuarii BL J]|uniref:Putative membrane protein n=1 Tax=Lyngbya aestuarii BL J TaxID=1348334 RepID=U7QR28_9CYAN|nr:hypothetical protein [Lyngbya aestuarii]ERT09565.1 putative membrane protein [Lyngbya aestuarii BL J]